LSENAFLTLETVGPFLGRIQARVAGLSLPGELEGRFPRAALSARFRSLRRRLREGAGAPLRVALFGPTGAGKSKIFNSLAGRELSPSGYRRPFTRRAVYLVHEARKGLFGAAEGADGAGAAETAGPARDTGPAASDVRVGADPAFRDVVLVDTPDFDSVEAENRREAERILAEADAVVFVTDAQKYADRSAWEYLERIFGEGKPTVLLLNKATAEATATGGAAASGAATPGAAASGAAASGAAASGAAEDFASRLEAVFGERARAAPRIVIREYPLEDAASLPETEPGLERLREILRDLAGTSSRRRSTLLGRLERDYAEALSLWAAAESTLRGYLEGVRRLEGRTAERFDAAAAGLGTELDSEVDPALKAEVYSRLLERLQKIDVLRYPRRLLALPFRGLRTVIGRWVPGLKERETGTDEAEEAASTTVARNEAFQALESILLRLSYETREEFRAEGSCGGILDDRDFSEIRIGHGELEERFREAEETFREWLRGEAEKTASTLTSEHKLKFILSQVIFNAAMVGVQVHTAGGFTIAEAMTDTVVSPLIAKAVGVAVSKEALGKFTRRAREEHREILANIVRAARDRTAAHLAARRAWERDLEAIARDVAHLARSREGLVGGFERSAVERTRRDAAGAQEEADAARDPT
jgi:hypothetical protein